MKKQTQLGLGTGYLCSVSGPTLTDAKKLFALALDHGIDFVDTSPRYGQGDAEKLVGHFAKKAKFTICTKVGYQPRDKDWLIRFLKPYIRLLKKWKGKPTSSAPATPSSGNNVISSSSPPQDFSSEFVEKSILSSLKILNNPSDLYCLLHDPPFKDEDEVSEIAKQMEMLTLNGYIEKWGLGTSNLEALKTYTAIGDPDIVQTSFFPTEREEKLEFFKTLKPETVVIVNSVFSGLKTKEEREEAIRAVVESGVVDYLLLGTTSCSHLEDNIKLYKGIIEA